MRRGMVCPAGQRPVRCAVPRSRSHLSVESHTSGLYSCSGRSQGSCKVPQDFDEGQGGRWKPLAPAARELRALRREHLLRRGRTSSTPHSSRSSLTCSLSICVHRSLTDRGACRSWRHRHGGEGGALGGEAPCIAAWLARLSLGTEVIFCGRRAGRSGFEQCAREDAGRERRPRSRAAQRSEIGATLARRAAAEARRGAQGPSRTPRARSRARRQRRHRRSCTHRSRRASASRGQLLRISPIASCAAASAVCEIEPRLGRRRCVVWCRRWHGSWQKLSQSGR